MTKPHIRFQGRDALGTSWIVFGEIVLLGALGTPSSALKSYLRILKTASAAKEK